jgi:hypothetical protein
MWTTFRSLWDTLIPRCEASAPTESDARAIADKLPPNPRMIFGATVERVGIFQRLQASSARFGALVR